MVPTQESDAVQRTAGKVVGQLAAKLDGQHRIVFVHHRKVGDGRHDPGFAVIGVGAELARSRDVCKRFGQEMCGADSRTGRTWLQDTARPCAYKYRTSSFTEQIAGLKRGASILLIN